MLKTCTLDNCKREHRARGLCGKHYAQEKKANGFVPKPARLCTVVGCALKHYAKGMCNTHYLRDWHRGTTDARPSSKRVCEVVGCERPNSSYGNCRLHHRRVQTTGTTDPSWRGYSSIATGTFYLVANDELGVVKYGITNNPVRRFSGHKLSGFDRVIASYTNDDGRVAHEAERLFHDLRSTLAPAVEADAMRYGGYTETFIAADFRAEHGLTAAAWFDLAWDLANDVD